MKKKILSAMFAVAIMAVAGYNVYVNQTKNGMSELALANIEALADPESSNGVKTVSITELGTDEDCVEGRVHKFHYFQISCLGEGNIPCTPSIFTKVEKTTVLCAYM